MQQLSEIMLHDQNIIFNANDQHFRCFAHILYLAVQDMLKLLKADEIEEDSFDEDDNSESVFEKNLDGKSLNKLRACS